MIPPLLQEAGIPLDLFISSLTEQLDKAQATMALKARVGKLPMTFAVKELSLDLRAFVQMVDDDVYLRPAGPGDTEASTLKLALTTITKSMIEENAMDFASEDPKFNLREALGDKVSEEDQRRLERIGVRTVTQLTELRKTAGADVIARLSRMPVNRLQQALLAASAPRVTRVDMPPRGGFNGDYGDDTGAAMTGGNAGTGRGSASGVALAPRVHLSTPLLRPGRLPLVRAAGQAVPVAEAQDGQLVLQPLASQLGSDAEVDFGDGHVATVPLTAGSLGRWHEPSRTSREPAPPLRGQRPSPAASDDRQVVAPQSGAPR